MMGYTIGDCKIGLDVLHRRFNEHVSMVDFLKQATEDICTGELGWYDLPSGVVEDENGYYHSQPETNESDLSRPDVEEFPGWYDLPPGWIEVPSGEYVHDESHKGEIVDESSISTRVQMEVQHEASISTEEIQKVEDVLHFEHKENFLLPNENKILVNLTSNFYEDLVDDSNFCVQEISLDSSVFADHENVVELLANRLNVDEKFSTIEMMEDFKLKLPKITHQWESLRMEWAERTQMFVGISQALNASALHSFHFSGEILPHRYFRLNEFGELDINVFWIP